jgi:hypothetical protein
MKILAPKLGALQTVPIEHNGDVLGNDYIYGICRRITA